MKYLQKILWFIEFVFFYIWKVIESNAYVAYKIMKPTLDFKPAVVEVPVNLEGKWPTLLYFNLITMTPGTLSMDYITERKSIFVHTVNYESDIKLQENLQKLENIIKKTFD